MSRRRTEKARQKSSTTQAAPREAQRPAANPDPVWGPYAGVAAILLVVLVVAFSPCLKNEFQTSWDDDKNFLENPSYRGLGWDQIRWDWTSFRIGVYQPLAWMILGAQYCLFGLRPWGYHLTSLILYAADTVVLFALTVALLARCRPELRREGAAALPLGAGLAVALFAAHPLRAEVVAWASCQPYLPCALFSMLAVLAYLGAYPEGAAPRLGRLVIAFGLFAAALLSKAVAVGLPAVLLILDVYPLRRLGGGPGRWFGPSARRVYLEKVPFVALSVIFMALAIVGRVDERHLASVEDWSFSARIAQACYGIWFYPIKTVLPVNITAYYAVPERVVWFESPFVLGILGTLVVSVVLFLLRRRWPGLLAVWASYLVILAPNLGLIRIGGQIAADRYSYMAMMGGVVLLAGGLSWAWQTVRRVRPLALISTAACLGVLLGLTLLTRAQCQTWRTSETLWTHVLGHGGSRTGVAHNNLGVVLNAQGRVDEATDHFAEALRLNPNYVDAHVNMGANLVRNGRIEEAMAHFEKALQLNPNNPDPYNNCAMIWATAPEAKHRDGRRAVAAASRACELTHWSEAGILDTYAAAAAEAGDFGSAVKWETRAIDLLTDERGKDDFRSRLRLYRAGQPYREAFR